MSKKTTGDDIWKNNVEKIVCIYTHFFGYEVKGFYHVVQITNTHIEF